MPTERTIIIEAGFHIPITGFPCTTGVADICVLTIINRTKSDISFINQYGIIGHFSTT